MAFYLIEVRLFRELYVESMGEIGRNDSVLRFQAIF